MTSVSINWRAALQPSQFWQRTLLALTGGLLLGYAHVNANFYFLTWFALLPLLLAIQNTHLKQSYFLGFVYGIGLYTVGAFWIVDFLHLFKSYEGMKNYSYSSLFWIYSAQLPACLAITYQWLRKQNAISDLILFPAVTAFYFASFPVLFSAQLGETQSQFLTVLQPIEFFGVYGLDLIIGLFTICIFKFYLNELKAQHAYICATIFAAWIGYGLYSYQAWENEMSDWKSLSLGLVQPNETPDIATNKVQPGYSRTYPPEMDMTERLAEAGAELIVWPEAKYKGYINSDFVKKAYKHKVKELGVSLIFQDMEDYKVNINNHIKLLQYNGAVMLDNNGEQQPLYRKQKRVAFGEYVPFISDILVLRIWVESFFGEFLTETAKGPGPVTFVTDTAKIIPLICYETMFPKFVADAMPTDTKGSILVGLSSNGWFGNSAQPYQHIYSASLRAIENRSPMVHSLNNGPSVVTLPNGREIFKSEYHQAGGYVVEMPYSKESGGSLFSNYPWITLYLIYSILILTVLYRIPLTSTVTNTIFRLENNNK